MPIVDVWLFPRLGPRTRVQQCPGRTVPDVDRVVAVMRKTKDVNQSQAEGLVKLIEDATKVVGRNLDVYA